MTPSSLVSLAKITAGEVSHPRARAVAKEIAADPALNEGVQAMMERHSEMRSPLTALLAGIAADPKARRLWNETLDEMWAPGKVVPKTTTIYPEVFIGSGLMAAVFCATRAAAGRPIPLVLEAEDRVGGVFAVSHTPGFYLNSRNRPGGYGIPGSQGALNLLPNAPVQPSELGFEEYQVNSDLAYAIRSVFAHTGAQVATGVRVYGAYVRPVPREKYRKYVELRTQGGGIIKASNVIVGIGLQPKEDFYSSKLLRFAEFMRRMDEPFPFKGIGRVAVIGAGDSGKVVIEALTGQGPARHMSVAALDYPRDIVWYGQRAITRSSFEDCNRPRYKRIGTLLSGNGLRSERVTAIPNQVGFVEDGYNCVLVDGQPYDLAIDCTGTAQNDYVFNERISETYDWLNEAETDVYAKYSYGSGAEDDGEPRIFFVGPVARIGRTDSERRALPEPADPNRSREGLVAAYRYTGRTAMFAQAL